MLNTVLIIFLTECNYSLLVEFDLVEPWYSVILMKIVKDNHSIPFGHLTLRTMQSHIPKNLETAVLPNHRKESNQRGIESSRIGSSKRATDIQETISEHNVVCNSDGDQSFVIEPVLRIWSFDVKQVLKRSTRVSRQFCNV